MKRLLLTVAFVALNVMAYAQIFDLTGDTHSHEYDGLTMYMYECGVGDRELTRCIDSTTVADGRYRFRLKASAKPYMVRLALPMKNRYFGYGLDDAECVVEEGIIKLDYLDSGIAIQGGAMNAAYEEYILKPYRETRSRVNKALDSLNSVGVHDNNDFIREQYALLNPGIIRFIEANIGNPVGAYMFFGRPRDFFPSGMYENLYQQVDSLFRQRHEQRLQRETHEREYAKKAYETTRKGNPYRDFSSKTMSGEDVKFSDFVKPGHVTMLDMWASWCGPCRGEAPEIVRLYEKYHEKGLDMVSLSLDNNRSAWLKAVEELHFTWPQLCSGQAWKDEAVKTYAVQSVPFVILIDKNGRLADKNVHGEKLEELIVELLAE